MMHLLKKTVMILVLSAGPSVARAQSTTTKDAPNHDQIFTFVEEMPRFPGGDQAMARFLAENIKYPAQAIKDGSEGRVYTKFVVRKDSSLYDIKIVRGVSADIDAEAIRLIKAMPKWIPGKLNGRAVDVSFTLPVTFRLD